MDVMSASSDLRQLLVAHDNSNRQIAALDAYIHTTSLRQLRSYIGGEHAYSLTLALRLSVIEGIHTMYILYQQRKWAQVQEKARSIISALQNDHLTELNEEQVVTPLHTLGSSNTDRTVQQWLSHSCCFYRNC